MDSSFLVWYVELTCVSTNVAGAMWTYLGRAGMEQRASRSRSQLVLLRLHSHSGVGRLVGVTVRRQARVRCGHFDHARRHDAGSGSGTCSCRSAHHAACHHGARMCTYSPTRWLYRVECPQYSTRLEALDVYFLHSTRPSVT